MTAHQLQPQSRVFLKADAAKTGKISHYEDDQAFVLWDDGTYSKINADLLASQAPNHLAVAEQLAVALAALNRACCLADTDLYNVIVPLAEEVRKIINQVPVDGERR